MAYGKEAAKTKREKMTDEEVGAIAVQALQSSLGGPGTEVSQARLRNLEYYNAEATGELAPPEIEDRSDFVATDVADTIEGMLPQLMRMFVASDDAVEFEAKRPGAEPIAKLATAYINHLFYTRNDGVSIVYDWFKDALLQKVGFVKVWAEEESDDARQTFEGQTEEQLVMLAQEGWQLDGEPEVDETGGLIFTVTKEDRRTCIKAEVCPPDAVRVDPNARWGGDPALIGHVFRRRKFELEQDGYDLSDLPRGSGEPADSEETLEMLGQSMDSDAYAEPTESHSLYNCAEVYMQLDRDGDGTAEWLKICLIEDTLARYVDDDKAAIEQVDGHPFVWICPIPRPHAFFGDCPADFAIGPQKLRTNTVRGIQDNLMLTVNQRTYINLDAEVNMADWLENRPGGAIRGRGPANTAIQPLVQPNLSAPAYQFNEWLEDWRATRTGFTKYSQGTDADSLNKTATGVSIITQKSDMRMELMARFFAVGMKQLFAKMLKLAVRHQDREEQMQVAGGQWVALNPSEWRDQFNVKINVGLGTGSKEQQAQRIIGLLQTQLQAAQFGVITPENIAETVRLYVEANEFSNPERFVSPQPTGMPPTPQAYQEEKQQVMQSVQKMQEELQRLSQENDGLKTDQTTKMAELELKARELDRKDQEIAQNGMKAAAELDLKRDSQQVQTAKTAQEMARGDDEDAKVAQLQDQVAQLTQAVQYLLQQIAPPDGAQEQIPA
ncbi:portal protein [Lysobacter panacisoli]|uniref:Portal protein n=1 Tax=Lysobacter panacisoli TaxID=1255263 RepID=A0ABP9LGF0_9GAMM|nr:hypothetical protein [Lysobacter panacisoli]